jgi:glutathione S-transferase
MVKSRLISSREARTALPKLYVIPGSHACRAAMLMLEHKGVEYRPAEIPTGFQAPVMRARRFPGRTVPALLMNGRRVQTNRRIARFLDALAPETPLLPRDRREEIEEAERFADEVLQPTARRLVLAAGRRDLGSLVAHADSGRLGPILARSRRRRARIMRIAARYPFGISDHTEALDLAALPEVMDRVDAWVEQGVLNGSELNAADFQITPSVALLAYRKDLSSEIEGRAVWRLVDRLIPAPAAAQALREEAFA